MVVLVSHSKIRLRPQLLGLVHFVHVCKQAMQLEHSNLAGQQL